MERTEGKILTISLCSDASRSMFDPTSAAPSRGALLSKGRRNLGLMLKRRYGVILRSEGLTHRVGQYSSSR